MQAAHGGIDGKLYKTIVAIVEDLGGITSTLGYMLENEAYRVLPQILKKRYGIEATERFLRRSIRSFGVK